MEYKELFKDENEAVKERYELVMGRIQAVLTEETVSEPYRGLFNHAAEFILLTHETAEIVIQGKLRCHAVGGSVRFECWFVQRFICGLHKQLSESGICRKNPG